jgi:hypothetical protein
VTRVAVAAALLAAAAAIAFGVLWATTSPTKSAAPCGEQRLYGHVAGLAHKEPADELRFDPAWFTSGLTANTAAAEDGAVPAGQPVPNDNYVVDETHRAFVYKLPAGTPITVLTRGGPGPLGETPVGLPELERIVNGGRHRALFEPLDSGVWIRVHGDTVCAFDQQYRP